MLLCISWRFEGTFENALWRKIQCNQCDYASIQAGDLTFENTPWRKFIQCNFAKFKHALGNPFWKKSYKCNLCDFASVTSRVLRNYKKTHTGKKSHNAANETLHLFVQAFEDNFENSF